MVIELSCLISEENMFLLIFGLLGVNRVVMKFLLFRN